MHDGSLKGLVYSTVCVRYSFVEGMGLVCPKRRFGLQGGLSRALNAGVVTASSAYISLRSRAAYCVRRRLLGTGIQQVAHMGCTRGFASGVVLESLPLEVRAGGEGGSVKSILMKLIGLSPAHAPS